MLAFLIQFVENPAPVAGPKGKQSSGGLVKIWPGEVARPFFLCPSNSAGAARTNYKMCALRIPSTSGLRHARQVLRPQLLTLRSQLVQILPGVQAGIVAIIE